MDKIRKEFNKFVRNKYIEEHPNCEYCGKKAQHVHHIIPISSGGDNRESNLIALCLMCHGIIHHIDFNELEKKRKDGIQKAKIEGKYKGRQLLQIDKNKYFELKTKYMHRLLTKTMFAKQLGVSRPTLDKILKNEARYFF